MFSTALTDNGFATVVGYTPEWTDFSTANPSARLVIVKAQTPSSVELYSGYMQGWAGAAGTTIDFPAINVAIYR